MKNISLLLLIATLILSCGEKEPKDEKVNSNDPPPVTSTDDLIPKSFKSVIKDPKEFLRVIEELEEGSIKDLLNRFDLDQGGRPNSKPMNFYSNMDSQLEGNNADIASLYTTPKVGDNCKYVMLMTTADASGGYMALPIIKNLLLQMGDGFSTDNLSAYYDITDLNKKNSNKSAFHFKYITKKDETAKEFPIYTREVSAGANEAGIFYKYAIITTNKTQNSTDIKESYFEVYIDRENGDMSISSIIDSKITKEGVLSTSNIKSNSAYSLSELRNVTVSNKSTNDEPKSTTQTTLLKPLEKKHYYSLAYDIQGVRQNKSGLLKLNREDWSCKIMEANL